MNKKLGKISLIAAGLLFNGYVYADYPLTCRGGGGLSIHNASGNQVQIRFLPGNGAVTNGLQPGQCTWSDRALRDSEPRRICDSSASASSYVAQLLNSNAYTIFQIGQGRPGCFSVTRVGP